MSKWKQRLPLILCIVGILAVAGIIVGIIHVQTKAPSSSASTDTTPATSTDSIPVSSPTATNASTTPSITDIQNNPALALENLRTVETLLQTKPFSVGNANGYVFIYQFKEDNSTGSPSLDTIGISALLMSKTDYKWVLDDDTGFDHFTSLDIEDVNNDGKLEFVAQGNSGQSGSLRIYSFNNGSFEKIFADAGDGGVEVKDFNGDGVAAHTGLPHFDHNLLPTI